MAEQWSALTFYQRFESGVTLALTLIITLVIVVALFRLVVGVMDGLVFGVLNPLDHEVFQTVFGEIMTLLIALEFNHTLNTWSPGSRASFRQRSSCSLPCSPWPASSSSSISKRRLPMSYLGWPPSPWPSGLPTG